MRYSSILLLVLSLMLFSGCSQESIANRGFSLPDGDAEHGRLLFMEYKCIECHTLAGTEFVGDDKDKLTADGGIAVELGGVSTRVQTYGDLVSSVINPSHRIATGYPLEQITENGESKMAYYNDVLTVTELVDLVTFLKSKYEIKPYPDTIYPYYVYPY